MLHARLFGGQQAGHGAVIFATLSIAEDGKFMHFFKSIILLTKRGYACLSIAASACCLTLAYLYFFSKHYSPYWWLISIPLIILNWVFSKNLRDESVINSNQVNWGIFLVTMALFAFPGIFFVPGFIWEIIGDKDVIFFFMPLWGMIGYFLAWHFLVVGAILIFFARPKKNQKSKRPRKYGKIDSGHIPFEK
ncbi:MAG: hypothetical protein Q4A28_07055 [Brachymonas sp.]|nr:hypothetical protein [Brachymonas sp.]